uniref:Ubiquitin-like domain-containing protein n=1 Tax=Vombatus ursinus TaxID=29139 RepID=A0A4X2LAL0_VOMUR
LTITTILLLLLLLSLLPLPWRGPSWQIRFLFDGQPVNETDTPAQLEMEDEDTIDVFQQQTGGPS